jgi:hypothetical protein
VARGEFVGIANGPFMGVLQASDFMVAWGGAGFGRFGERVLKILEIEFEVFCEQAMAALQARTVRVTGPSPTTQTAPRAVPVVNNNRYAPKEIWN